MENEVGLPQVDRDRLSKMDDQLFEERELRNRYATLLEVNQLLLAQVANLGQSFRALNLPNQTKRTQEATNNKIQQALSLCDVLQSAIDLGTYPNENTVIGFQTCIKQNPTFQIDSPMKSNKILEGFTNTTNSTRLSTYFRGELDF
ncbi:hypothetical protein I6N95_25075 [Vagococcus sp. BWB3-3]|uniref:Uncharacterized protein n=1 Tax=Vagococcus allomyrinae TaxID=2794353 RepID=A0A940PAZ8_9ENTE|nr:hypothetical protein [Vagococcus allomyrinae]MBP1044285.1 hypothetical protein [Vagococcus allomyrinae]